MKFEPQNLDRQKLHDFISDSLSPLPIAFISTVGEDGVFNAAPFSFVSPVSTKPPILCVSFGLKKGQKKDTVRNIEYTGDFVVNIVDNALLKPAIQTSADYPSNIDEIKQVGLTSIPSIKVKSPRIAEAPISLECKVMFSLELGDGINLRKVVFGEIVLFHVKDEVCSDGSIQPKLVKPIARLGKNLYCHTTDSFEVKTPRL